LGAAYAADAITVLKALPDESVNAVITSPPYALHFKKEYGNVDKQSYVQWMLPFAREIKRVLKKDGSFILNMWREPEAHKPWGAQPSRVAGLFIIVHQAYELWFKQVLQEFDRIERDFSTNPVDDEAVARVVHSLARIHEILKLLVAQLDVLETMTPADFLDFRDYLFPASGFNKIVGVRRVRDWCRNLRLQSIAPRRSALALLGRPLSRGRHSPAAGHGRRRTLAPDCSGRRRRLGPQRSAAPRPPSVRELREELTPPVRAGTGRSHTGRSPAFSPLRIQPK